MLTQEQIARLTIYIGREDAYKLAEAVKTIAAAQKHLKGLQTKGTLGARGSKDVVDIQQALANTIRGLSAAPKEQADSHPAAAYAADLGMGKAVQA